MDRLVLLVIACVGQVGCQAPATGFNPFGVRQTRVPPPPTGVIGDSGDYDSPPPNAGAYIPPTHVPGQHVTNVGPWRYWESANARDAQRAASRSPESVASRPNPSSNPPPRSAQFVGSARGRRTSEVASATGLRRNDSLGWKEPIVYESSGSQSYTDFVASSVPAAYSNSQPVGSGYPPRLLPQTGPVTPLATVPVRVRGFSNSYRRQPVGIPVELAEFQGNVRQASATSKWETRYDDVRR